MKKETSLILEPESLLPIGEMKKGEFALEYIFNNRYPCIKCVKLRVNRKTQNLVSSCAAFTYFCFQWEENKNTRKPWAINCFGYCGSENQWLDTQDEIHSYIVNRKMNVEGLSKTDAESYYANFQGQYNSKLNGRELVGLKQLYYEETHPKLSGAPKNESCGTSCKIIKKNPILDNDGGGESWRNIGSMNYYGEGTKGGANSGLGVYDAIEENKKRKRAEAKKAGTEDKTKDLKGARKPNTGKKKESKTTDTTVITKDIAKTRRGIKK